MKTTIYHPKCKELKGTIEQIKLSKDDQEKFESNEIQFEVIDFNGYEDWYDDYDEALKDLNESLENQYNGSTQRDIANDKAYARQESRACGNY